MRSRRVELLKELLERINAYGTFPELGLKDYAELRSPLEADRELGEDERRVTQIIDLMAEFSSALNAKTRTTAWTGNVRDDIARFASRVGEQLNAMSEPARTNVVQFLREVAESNPESIAALLVGTSRTAATEVDEAPVHQESPEAKGADVLDRHYSAEVLDKLNLILERASRLSHLQLGVQQQPSRELERYFSEAHECYLYGFPVACTALCRAILESALKLKLPGKFEDLGERIEAAHEKGYLSQASRVWAYEIKDLGNSAIHQYDRFARGDLVLRVEDCLLKTRRIVEELLSDRIQAEASGR
jgi:uncharacterized protein DUF4145